MSPRGSIRNASPIPQKTRLVDHAYCFFGYLIIFVFKLELNTILYLNFNYNFNLKNNLNKFQITA
ncbi:hypothetical protein [Borreliella garinii]|uniref:hypothetical protein n=1 Tax=Borreliella garinii TaxID=29519 RepID=UPI001AEFB8F3|nr:hypothetical protein [Borreliella garinii]